MKNRINKIIGKGEFHLIDHSISHNQFLYRSFVKEGLNRDILISGVSYISLPMTIEDFKVYKGESGELEKIKNKVDSYNYQKVFVFEEKNFKHYVIADRILIQENDFLNLETSIPIKREETKSVEELKELSLRIIKEFEEKGYKYMIEKLRASDWQILE